MARWLADKKKKKKKTGRKISGDKEGDCGSEILLAVFHRKRHVEKYPPREETRGFGTNLAVADARIGKVEKRVGRISTTQKERPHRGPRAAWQGALCKLIIRGKRL